MNEAIQIAIAQVYLGPLQALIERKARYYLALSERDAFSMTDEEAVRHHRRLRELADEIELLDNLSGSIEAIRDTYAGWLQAAETSLTRAARDYTSLQKNHLVLSEIYKTDQQYLNLLHDIIILSRP